MQSPPTAFTLINGLVVLRDADTRPCCLQDRAQWELSPFLFHAYLEEKVGEHPDPEPPLTVADRHMHPYV